jgi:hypothetical protein
MIVSIWTKKKNVRQNFINVSKAYINKEGTVYRIVQEKIDTLFPISEILKITEETNGIIRQRK